MEKEIKKLIANGLSQREVANELKITRYQVQRCLCKINNTITCKFCNKSLNKSSGQDKYCSLKCQQAHMRKLKEQKIEKEGNLPEGIGFQFLRRYLIDKYKNKCSICGRTTWNEQPIPIVIDHIDGCSENNTLSNLRLVCCNCDALLPTYKGKNRGNGRAFRRQRYAEGKSY